MMRLIQCREGVNDEERIAVTSDALDIVRRIKEIYDGYFVMLNRRTQKFEVHVRGQKCRLGCELLFELLDARAVEYVRRHERDRIDEYMLEMEKEEARRQRARDARLYEAAERMADGLAFLHNKTTDKFPEEAIKGFKYDASRDVRASGGLHRPEGRLCDDQRHGSEYG